MANLIRTVVLFMCLSFALSCRRSCPEDAETAGPDAKGIPGTSMMYAAKQRESVSSMFAEYVQTL